MEHKVISPTGTFKIVKNLGWLLRNRNNHEGIRNVFGEKVEGMEYDALLIVVFNDDTTYLSQFNSFEIMVDWIKRYLKKYTDCIRIDGERLE